MAAEQHISRRALLKGAAPVAAGIILTAGAASAGSLPTAQKAPQKDRAFCIDGIPVGAFATVTSDRMEPSLRIGDGVFVDTSATRFAGDDLYLFQFPDGAVQVYRVQQAPDGTLSFLSDNKAYAPLDGLSRETPFVGRAIGYLINRLPAGARA